jgi:ribosomal protein S7
VDRESALNELTTALADAGPEGEEKRLQRVGAAFYEAIRVQGCKQADLARRYEVSRETIRRHVEDERIRRGEIPPTERYLKAQARRRARSES